MTLSDKEIEIERLLTTVEGLNAKVAVIKETEADCVEARTRFSESE